MYTKMCKPDLSSGMKDLLSQLLELLPEEGLQPSALSEDTKNTALPRAMPPTRQQQGQGTGIQCLISERGGSSLAT